MFAEFNGKVAVVTGAGSGIGRELARQLAASGCHLALSDINENGLNDTVKLLPNREAIKLTKHILDVTDRDAVADYTLKVIGEHQKVDLLFNNAGIGPRVREMADYEYSDYENVLNVNLWGVIHCTHNFLPHLLANPGSHLVNISSVLGFVAPAKSGSYAISKFAVRGYTEGLRSELQSRNVHVSCVHPGLIATNIVAAAGASDKIIEQFAEDGLSAESTARIILKGVARKKARIRVGKDAYFVDWLQRLMPVRYRSVLRHLIIDPDDEVPKVR
jgi:short-subunit dehydrogenase